MTILSVVGQKGGVGKSAISRLVAVAAANRGLVTRICDLDPSQGTSTQWQIRRDRMEVDPEVPVEKCRTVEAALRRAAETDLLILDGPAQADVITSKMAKASDLVILPTGFGRDDIDPQVNAIFEIEEKFGDAAPLIRLVFCRSRGSASEEAVARSYIRKTGLDVLEHTLREMPSIRQAHNTGRAANETGYPSVDTAAQRVADEILALVATGNPSNT